MTYSWLPACRFIRNTAFVTICAVSVSLMTHMLIDQHVQAATDSTDIVFLSKQRKESLFGAYLAARHAEELAEFGRAADLLDRLYANSPDDTSLARRTLMANIYAGRMDRAVEMAQGVVAQFPDRIDASTLLLASEAIRAKDWSTARAMLEDRERITIARFATPAVLAWIAVGEGDIDGAIEALSELREDNQVADLHDYNAGLIFLSAGRFEEADAVLSPYGDNLFQAPVLIIRALARARIETKGAEVTTELLNAYQEARGPVDRIAYDLQQIEQTGRLRPLTSGPETGIAQTMVELAIRVRRQAPRLALRYLNTAIRMDPSNDIARIVVGSVMETFDQHEAAIAVLSEIDDDSVHQWAARQEISNSLIALQRDEEAIAMLEEMAAERPDDLASLNTLGWLMRTRERFEEGIEYYDRALAAIEPDDPGAWNFYYGRGISLERTQQWEKAEPDFLKALELNADEPYVLNYLGYSWVDQGKRLQEGLAMIERAVHQRPNDPYIVDSLGWAHYRLGNFEEAVNQLERAVQLRAGNAIINDHLGDAYWHVGRLTEARFQWERSRFLEDADDALRARIDDKLERGLDAVEADEAAAER